MAAKKVATTVEQKLAALKARAARLKTKAKAAEGEVERKLRKGVRRAQRKARSVSAAMKKLAKAVTE